MPDPENSATIFSLYRKLARYLLFGQQNVVAGPDKKMQDRCHLLCTLEKSRFARPYIFNLSIGTFVQKFSVYGLNDGSSELTTLCLMVFIGVTLTT